MQKSSSAGAERGPPGVFLCYRREDSSGYAGRLHDYVKTRFPNLPIFIDIDAIRPGEDFHARIAQAIDSSSVVLALIGPRWEGQTLGGTRRRIDDADDLVRIELMQALATGRPVIPVLVHGAHMVASRDLPKQLRALGRRNAIALHDTSWKSDVEMLLDELGRLLGQRSSAQAAPSAGVELLDETAPGASPPTRTNIPAPATALVGRHEQLAAVDKLLRRAEIRLVTLTGPGGIGKTRLALALASQLLDEFDGGVWWVPLESIREPALVLSKVAQTMGAKGDLRAHIANSRTLIVLDNCEQVLAVAPELAELLSACPRLSILATSRAPLHLIAEHEYPVSPLPATDAVELFAERARAVLPEFTSDDDVKEICDRLDGLPLAIELAAAWVKALPTEGILDRLVRRLPLLAGGARDRPPRQQTLSAAIAWSYDLLAPDEKRIFARLGVFVGGCTLDAAEAICEANLITLARLVDTSLVLRDGDRYRMLETIREYALLRLDEAAEAEEIRAQHSGWYVRLAKRLDADLYDAEATNAARTLEMEHPNLRAALQRARELNDTESLLGLATSLAGFWHVRGYVREGLAWLNQALSSNVTEPNLTLAKAHNRAGALAEVGGDAKQARVHWETALRIGGLLDAEKVIATANGNLGVLALAAGDYEDAAQRFREATRFFSESGDELGASLGFDALATTALLQGRAAEAAPLVESAVDLARKVGNERHLAAVLHTRGMTQLAQGDVVGAGESLEEALEAALFADDPAHVVAVVEGFAAADTGSGSSPKAVRLFSFADTHRAATGISDPVRRSLATSYRERAQVSLGAADLEQARSEGQKMTLDDAVAEARSVLPESAKSS